MQKVQNQANQCQGLKKQLSDKNKERTLLDIRHSGLFIAF